MGINVQTRLKNIEGKLKAMKVCYNTAGSLVKMYAQKSDVYIVGGSGYSDVTIKFTPFYGRGKSNLISLNPIVKSGGVVVTAPAMQKPQDGSGDVYITIYNLLSTQTVEIIASGISPGTFTRIS